MDSPKEEAVETLNASKREIMMSLIKQIKVGGEVVHMVLPCFLLQPRSTLESFTDMFSCLDELFKVNEINDSQQRFLQFIKFYLSGWHTRPMGIKKPFNPVIGEVFEGFWDKSSVPISNSNNNSEMEDITVFEAEQISHHPPLSAYCLYNKARGIVVNGNVTPAYVKYLGNSAESHLQGVLSFNFFNVGERFTATLPTIGVKGIILGKLSPFTCGKAIVENDRFKCELEFLYKGLLGRTKNINGIKGEIYDQGKLIYKLKGNWDKKVYLVKPDDTETLLLDVSTLKPYHIGTKPIEEQPPNSSYHMWQKVTENILANNDRETAAEKQKIEEKQRIEEAERKKTGKKWVPTKFIHRPMSQKYPDTYMYKELDNLFPNQYSSKATQ
ncbi:hypothetical protein CYY_002851 [Polysphondylium violaceum]|uniref:Oxysterol binding family protein n=1 Tax=Polysphondylium violaceum TaxID=133409 RepID=A0A8J4PY70_9MYCE|nr:hypothetical protein CYY_002851 [Polysphondylium violaceum]